MLIALAAFNNLLGGVFMALMDAYGLSLVSVETWGFLWGVISLAFIAGGLVVARFGLGPDRRCGSCCSATSSTGRCARVFALRSSIVMLTIGMVVWLALIPVIEAAEQTVLQRSIPFERQGRVFGFAQLVENAASPLTAFLIGPLAETVFMPFMTDGRGADGIGELVRHRARARPRPDVHPRRPDRRGGHARRVRLSRSYRQLSAAWDQPAPVPA